MKHSKIINWGFQMFGFSNISFFFYLRNIFFFETPWNWSFPLYPPNYQALTNLTIILCCYYFLSIRRSCSFRNSTTCFVNARNAWVSIIVSELYFIFLIFQLQTIFFFALSFNCWYYYEPIIFHCYKLIISI